MTRQDLLGFERFYATTLRREAKKRAKRYPVVAALDMMGDHAAGIASDPAQNVLPFGRRA